MTVSHYLTSSLLVFDVTSTLLRVVAAFCIAAPLSVVVAYAFYKWERKTRILEVCVHFLKSIPPIALGPVMILTLGLGVSQKVVFVAWGMFFPIWVSSIVGFRSIDSQLLNLAKVLHLNATDKFYYIEFRSALVSIFGGVRTAFAIGLIMTFVAEGLGSSYGIGYRLSLSYDTYNHDLMFVTMGILGGIGVSIDRCVVVVFERACPWIKTYG